MGGTIQRHSSHLRSLTSLRFYAALTVLLFHMARFFDPLAEAKHIVGLGYTGVGFFFILSGFVLAWSRKPDDTAGMFYWRRFARVWPLHALTTVLAIPTAVVTGTVLTWGAMLPVLTLTQSWFQPNAYRFAFNGVSWSLSTEMFFYLLFPLLIRRLSTKRPALTAALVFAAMCTAALSCHVLFPTNRLEYLLYTMPAYRIGEFIIGICLALIIQSGWRARFTIFHATLATGAAYAALMISVSSVFPQPEVLPHFVADLWLLPGFVMILLAGATGDLRGDEGWIRSTWSVRLGLWSFALYMVHELVIRLFEPWVDALTFTGGAAAAVIVGVVAVSASGLLYERFEKPVEARLRALKRAQEPAADGHV